MSFSVSGVTFVPTDAGSHASSALSYMNTNLLVASLPIITATTANAIWQYLLGAGSLNQAYDQTLNSAGNSFNIAQCDDAQVLNCAPVAGTALIPATYSSLNLKVTATSAGACTVPAGTVAFQNTAVSWIVNTTTVIPLSTSAEVPCTASVVGPYQVTIGQITSFTVGITNLASVTNDQIAIPGRYAETVSQLRQRIITGQTIMAGVNGATLALRALPGISAAQVYFNPSSASALVLTGGRSVPARNAMIIIGGTSSLIASTYAAYMTAQTATSSGSTSQNWITSSGQTIPINYVPATTQNFYVKVTVAAALPLLPNYDIQIKNNVVALNSIVSLGQLVISEWIYTNALTGFSLATVTGVQVSLDGVTWVFASQANADAIPNFLTANITVVAV